ncbi:hypothetical protein J3Q64DRAFT_1315191 [Phycomyces blakesleeanus]|uniref:Uncharacterized protein n=1 Tax=Phycomyces blakesleeanus TaxID=4837 RepID=A0ABR3B5T6_PHYBL
MHTILDEIDGPNTKSKSPDESMKSNGEQNITDIKLSNNGDIDIKNSSIVDRSPLILDQQRSEKCLALWAQQGQSVIDWLEDQPTLEAIECLVECMFRIVRAIDDPKEKWTVETSEKFAILKQFTGQTSKQSDIENLARVLKSVRIPDSVINGVCDFWQDFKNASFFHYLGAIIVYANGSRHALAQKAVYYVENLISPFPGGFSPTVSHYSKQLGKLVFWNNSQSCAAFNTAQYEAAKLAFNSHLEKNKVLNIPRVKGSSEDYEYILQNIQLNLSEAFPKSIKMKEIDMDIAVPPKAWPDTTQPQSEQHKHYSKVVYEIIGLKVICSGVDYNYRTKTGIPLYSDYGHAVATASDICVSISVSPSGNDPFSYKVDKCICTIGDFDISFQETRHSLLNRLSIKKFKKNIKHVLIENIQRGVATIFSQLFSHQ